MCELKSANVCILRGVCECSGGRKKKCSLRLMTWAISGVVSEHLDTAHETKSWSCWRTEPEHGSWSWVPRESCYEERAAKKGGLELDRLLKNRAEDGRGEHCPLWSNRCAFILPKLTSDSSATALWIRDPTQKGLFLRWHKPGG